MKRILALMVWIAALSLGGCVVHGHAHGHRHWRSHGTVSVRYGHVCDAWCGHYYWHGDWYHAGHVHGPGCGHALSGGVWIRVR